MLVDLRAIVGLAFENIEDRIERINTQAHSEGFEDHEIDLLLRMYLTGLKTKRQLKYILVDRPRIREQKKLADKQDKIVQNVYNNVPENPSA